MDWKDKQAVREYHLNNWHRLRKQYLELLGNECVKCGSNEDLEFDHIDPTEKEYEIKALTTRKRETILKELAKCQLLCKSCHLQKTIAERADFRHGTEYGWMKKKCSCAKCYEAKRAWHDKRNARRRLSSDSSRGPYSKNPGHGTTAKYHRGCRCDKCRAANAAKARAARAKSKE